MYVCMHVCMYVCKCACVYIQQTPTLGVSPRQTWCQVKAQWIARRIYVCVSWKRIARRGNIDLGEILRTVCMCCCAYNYCLNRLLGCIDEGKRDEPRRRSWPINRNARSTPLYTEYSHQPRYVCMYVVYMEQDEVGHIGPDGILAETPPLKLGKVQPQAEHTAIHDL
jgi:hypothetical protein